MLYVNGYYHNYNASLCITFGTHNQPRLLNIYNSYNIYITCTV